MSQPIDMSAFEEQFADTQISPDIDDVYFEKVANLKDRINDLEGLNGIRSGMIDHLDVKLGDLDDMLRSLMEVVREIRNQKEPIDTEKRSLKREIGDDEKKIESLKRELSRLLSEIEARKRARMERALLDESTADLPWRVGINGQRALPHQIEGAHFLASSERAICGDQMGLGKTLESIITISLLRAKGKANKVLIFTPKPVLRDFEREIQKWYPKQFVHVLDHVGSGKEVALNIFKTLPQCILLTNYEVWRKNRSIIDMINECQFDCLILDEAHNLKNWTSGTAKGIREIVYAENQCPKCQFAFIDGARDERRFVKTCSSCGYRSDSWGDFCSIKNVIPMTGTVILNRPQEFFPLANLVDRVGFPDERAFLRDFCVQRRDEETGRVYWTFGPGGANALLRRMGSRYIGRTRESAGVIMPPQEIKHHYLELDPEKYPRQHKFNYLLREKARIFFDEEQDIMESHTLAWYNRVRQAASWPDGIKIKGCTHNPRCVDEDTGKERCKNPEVIFPKPGTPPIGESVLMDAAEEIIVEATESNLRIAAFCMFRAGADELERRCKARGMRVAKLLGGMPGEARQEIVDDFNLKHTNLGEHKYDVLIAQYKTASVGLNLTGAHELVCLEREWNPGMEAQVLNRLRRIDSKHETVAHILHAKGTATDLIDALIEQKIGMLGDFETQVKIREKLREWLNGDDQK